MGLNNVDSSNGYLEAVGEGGTAISLPHIAEGIDFTAVRNAIAKIIPINISVGSTADLLKTNNLLENGDSLIIIKNDSSIHEIIASDVTNLDPLFTMDTTIVTAGEIPSVVYRINEKIAFNDIVATKIDDTIEIVDPFISRASIATYVDGGILKYAAIDEARYEDGILLAENAATNLITYSENLSNSTWQDPLSQWSLGAIVADPSNALTAYTLNTTPTSSLVRVNLGVSAGTYIVSIWVKGDNLESIDIDIGDQDIKTALPIGPYPEWTRIHAEITTTSAKSYVDLQVLNNITNATSSIWGLQLETGLEISSYIKTEGGAQSRAADILVEGIPITVNRNLNSVAIVGNSIATKALMSTIGNKITEISYDAHIPLGSGVDLTLGLIAHYLLNNNADDSFGDLDGVSTSVDFQGDSAIFNSSNIVMPSSLYPIGAKTISLWFKVDSIGLSQVLWDTSGTASANAGITMYVIPDGTIVCWGTIASGSAAFTVSINTTIPISPNTLYHAIFSWDGTLNTDSVLFELVGHEKITNTATNLETNPATFPMMLGAASGTLAAPLTGMISNLRVYNEKKNQTFMDALFEEGYYPKTLPLPTTVGLIAHYPLTGTAEDSTGNYDGTEAGTLSYTDNDEFGSVVRCAGGTNYIQAPTPHIPNEITLSAWARIESGKTNLLFSKRDAVSANDYQFYVDSIKRDVVVLLWGLTITTVRSIAILDINKFYHLSVTYDGSNIKIYINGILDSTTPSTGSLSSVTTNLRIGHDWYSTTTLDGYIKDSRIYDRALSQQEITDIYNYEKNFRPIDIDDGLVAFYPLAKNSLDNYYNEYDGVDTAMTYDGLSAVFDGTLRNIAINPAYSVSSPTSWSIGCWVKINSVASTSYNMIFNAPKYDYGLWAKSDGTYQMFIWDGSTTHQVSPIIPSFDEFHHLVMTYDGTTLRTYINSVSSGLLIITTSPSNHNANGWIGRHGSLTPNMNGAIANIRSYNGVLSIEQIEIIYNTEKGDFI